MKKYSFTATLPFKGCYHWGKIILLTQFGTHLTPALCLPYNALQKKYLYMLYKSCMN